MKTNNKLYMRPLAALIVGVLVFPGVAMAASPAGQVLVASGKVKAVSADGKARDLNRRAPIYAGDKLVTATRANAQVKFTDGAIVSLKPSTELRVDEYAYEEGGLQKAFMSLVKGGFRTVTGAIGKTNRADYRVSTPVATIGIRGTLYDADFDPESGLDMAVWDGGIQACSESGCVDLGADANFRFGTIGTDGTFRGSNEQRSGGQDDGQGGAGGGSGDGDDDAGGVAGNEGAPQFQPDTDQEVGLLVSGLEPTDPDPVDPEPVDPLRADYPLVGLMVSGKNSLSNPLPVGVFALNYGQFGSYTDLQSNWLSWRLTAFGGGLAEGDYVVSGWDNGVDGCADSCRYSLLPKVWESGNVMVYWGTWSGYDSDGYYSELSVSQSAGVPSDVGVYDHGLYIFGTHVTPTVVSQLVGSTSFYYAGGMIGEGSSADVPKDGQGSLTLDLGTGVVDGKLTMEVNYGGIWNLAFGGAVSSEGFQGLSLKSTSLINRYDYMTTAWVTIPVDTANSQLALQFVGSSQVNGVIGSFDAWTLEANPANGQGVFLMTRAIDHLAFPLSGFGVAPGNGNPWGAGSVVQLDYAQFAESSMYGTSRLAATGNALGGQFLVSGVDTGSGCEGNCRYPFGTTYTLLGYDYTTKAYWGPWASGQLSVSANPYEASATAVTNPGYYVFGDFASPEVVAQLQGTSTSYSLLNLDATQYSPTAASDYYSYGNMDVDLTGSTPTPVTGAINVETSNYDSWHLAFTGSVTATGGLALNLTSDAVPANGSYFMPFNGIQGTDDKSVIGEIQGAFIGRSYVDGVVGAFDVKTTDGNEALMGVYLMSTGYAP